MYDCNLCYMRNLNKNIATISSQLGNKSVEYNLYNFLSTIIKYFHKLLNLQHEFYNQKEESHLDELSSTYTSITKG
jgi:hypothetical protein